MLGFSAGGLSGVNVLTGQYNIALGSEVMKNLTTGSFNLVAGPNGAGITTGTGNVILGNAFTSSGIQTGSGNVIVGGNAGQSIGDISSATVVGTQAGQVLTVPAVLLGRTAGQAITSGAANTGIGYQALLSVITGHDDTALGDSACDLLVGAESSDICIGSAAQVTAGVSNAVQIAAGTNPVAHSIQFESLPVLGTTKFTATGCTNTTTLGTATAGFIPLRHDGELAP